MACKEVLGGTYRCREEVRHEQSEARHHRGHASRRQRSLRYGRRLRLQVRRGPTSLPQPRGGRRVLRVARRRELPDRRVLLQEGARRAHPSGGPRCQTRGRNEGPQGDQRGGYGLLLRRGAGALRWAPLRDAVLREPRARSLAQGARFGDHGADGGVVGRAEGASRATVEGRRDDGLPPRVGKQTGPGYPYWEPRSNWTGAMRTSEKTSSTHP